MFVKYCETEGQNKTNQLFKEVLLLPENAIRHQPQISHYNDSFKENKIVKVYQLY